MTVRFYLGAWCALLALTLTSFGLHYLDLGPFATFVSLGFAGSKALIMFVVFMQLTREPLNARLMAPLNVAWLILICLGIALDIARQ